ncbi:NB-ARC domain-containing protein [Streptomyces sp. MS1.AVA.3]|uniref:NB-ARC domain-containing protein n=1 Tax=Streptomyces decoyicus TaxID=249567 RepID=UPI0030C57791
MEAHGDRAVAVGGDNYAPILTGDGARAVSLPREALRPPAEVAAPAGLDNLSVRPGLFVGRTAELDRLDGALADPGGVVVQAVHGLGGIGKSTLAAYWAATRTHGCAPIRWITADNSSSVQEGLVALAGALEPPLTDDALPPEALAERALQWLATHTGWLLLLDNVNDPADIAPLLARAHARGRFLITSRLATPWHGIPTVLRLDVLEETESLTLLTRIATTAGPRDLDGAAELCAELGHLPLAVEQVAAYLAQSPLPPPTCTYLPSTRRRCTATARSPPQPNASSPGSGTSPWTGSPPSSPRPRTCCAPWPGTPPTTSPPSWPTAPPTRPR